MCRTAIFAAFFAVYFQIPLLAGEPKDKTADLKKAVENADLIIFGKVTKTGLVAASSFDVGEVEASKVLLGDEKTKTAQIRIPGRMTPEWAKVGVEGIWILGKGEKWRNVLSFQPVTEEDSVKAIIKATRPGKNAAPDPKEK